MAAESPLFQQAIGQIDAANAQDPHHETVNGAPQPRELVYSRRLSDWVMRLAPDASETLRLAARCQHICRWSVPRDSYPMTKAGYLRWRADLKNLHARLAGEILTKVGYAGEIVQAVQALNTKKNFPKDPEAQILEDALCLVFLEFQFAELATRTDDEKMVNALRKSWQKMSEPARGHALGLSFNARQKELIQRALG